MHYNTILFDLDGTITDSGAGVMHGMELVLAHYGLPVPDRKALRVIIGPPLRDSLLRFGIRAKDVEPALELYRQFYNTRGWLENLVYPGIEPMLMDLKRHGLRLCVATSKPEDIAVQVLAHFGLAGYFDRICGASRDASRDSKESVIAWLLTQEENNASMVMVGDTHYDVLGAAAFGIDTIGIAWGYGLPEEMQQSGAIAIAHTPCELTAMLLTSG